MAVKKKVSSLLLIIRVLQWDFHLALMHVWFLAQRPVHPMSFKVCSIPIQKNTYGLGRLL